MAAPSSRPFITTHILETVTGKPAPNVPVTLTLLSPLPSSATSLPKTFTSETNSDGRITSWTASTTTTSSTTSSGNDDLSTLLATLKQQTPREEGGWSWSLTFQTEQIYGRGNTFWKEVELKFFTVEGQEHYHVPLLLGPWSYTTYRGS